ncbi:hypothetical protein [uncultured Mediterranean phage uvMED]|nr:hypothetical protein [uncultured Mediterranean phage uvMED]
MVEEITYNEKNEFEGTDPTQATPDEKWLNQDANEVKSVVNANASELESTTSKADSNENAINSLPPTPTNTSDLSNDGSDGLNPFITSSDLPDVSNFIEGQVYDENTSGLNFFLDPSVTNFEISMVKNGKMLSYNVRFNTSLNFITNQEMFRFPFPPVKFDTTKGLARAGFSGDEKAYKMDYVIGGIGQAVFTLFELVVTGDETTGYTSEYVTSQTTTATNTTIFIDGTFQVE